MPKKQNGFGNSKSFAFKGLGRTDVGKVKPAPGTYPSNRRYGTSVHRTVIEKYNLDSDWVKWRKGYEYYNQAAWYRLQDLDEFSGEYKDSQITSKLYQGTPYEVDVVFDGYKFATKNADSNNHYVMKRTTVSPVDLGTVTEVQNEASEYPENKRNREIWVKGTPGPDSRLLTRMVGERITDGETEATIDYVLTDKGLPALYVGKTYEKPTVVKVSVKKTKFRNSAPDLQSLIGKIVYMEDFYQERPTTSVDIKVTDDNYYWVCDVKDTSTSSIKVLDPESQVLPPSLYDINDLDVLAEADDCTYTLEGDYIYDKSIYQRFYGKTYLVGDYVVDNSDFSTYSIMPFTILGIEETDDEILAVSVPFTSEFRMTLPVGDGGATLVFPEYSFIKRGIETIGYETWTTIDTDVDPWMDEVFTTGNPLQPAQVYSCSCPNHAHAMLRAPQDTQDDSTRRINRQRRYPMPTVMGRNDFQSVGLNQAAGVVESWETREQRMGFKMCKHSIAAMFIDKIKVIEPSSYPTAESREKFEDKLAAEIAEVAQEFNYSYKRGGITALEVIFALAQGLNLDEVELAYVLLNSTF